MTTKSKISWAVFAVLGIILSAVFGPTMIKSYNQSIKEAQAALAAQPPMCFLIGEMKPTTDQAQHGLQTLGNTVKLKFGAKTIDDCKQLAMSYCTGNHSRGFAPLKLTMSFSVYSPVHKTQYFTVTQGCGLEATTGPNN